MARPRDFDADLALDAAMLLFWRRGFTGTSVRDLCEAMKVQPGSFYGAFTSKEECYRRALERYLSRQELPKTPGPGAILAWFDAIVDPAREPKGCLLVNSAMEAPLLHPSTQELVRARFARLEAYLCLCLSPRATAPADAALLFAAIIAIHIQARAGIPAKHLRLLRDRALECVGLTPRAPIS